MPAPVLKPRPGRAWTAEVRALVHKLEDDAPKAYDGILVAPYRAQQTAATAGRPYTAEQLDIITRRFQFAGGHAGTPGRTVVVRLTRLAMVDLLRAFRDVPQIEVGFGGAYDASLRTWTRQAQLYASYKAGGPRAAPPGPGSFHLRCAVDLGYRGPGVFPKEEGRLSMIEHGFFDLGSIDPPHFNRLKRG